MHRGNEAGEAIKAQQQNAGSQMGMAYALQSDASGAIDQDISSEHDFSRASAKNNSQPACVKG